MRIVLTFLLCLIINCLLGQRGARIVFETTSINCGAIIIGPSQIFEFKFQNMGDSSLIIENVSSSCGCLAPEYPNYPIQPGKWDVVKGLYSNLSQGSFSKVLTVKSNDKTTPLQVLTIEGQTVSRNEFFKIDIDTTIGNKFSSACNKSGFSHPQRVEKFTTSTLIFTRSQFDTLNKNEAIKSFNGNSLDNQRIENEKEFIETFLPRLMEAQVLGDSLLLSAGHSFSSLLKHHVIGNLSKSFYSGAYNYDSTISEELKKPNELVPVVTHKLILSTAYHPIGQIIYGQVEFETVPYALLNSGFKSGYIKVRLKGEYVFKVRVKKLNKHS